MSIPKSTRRTSVATHPASTKPGKIVKLEKSHSYAFE